MPQLTREQRQQGAHGGGDNIAPLPPEWQLLADRPRRTPDQSRYGSATTDPLGRDGPGWRIGSHGLPVRVKGDQET